MRGFAKALVVHGLYKLEKAPSGLGDLDHHVKRVHKSEEQPGRNMEMLKHREKSIWITERQMWQDLCQIEAYNKKVIESQVVCY